MRKLKQLFNKIKNKYSKLDHDFLKYANGTDGISKLNYTEYDFEGRCIKCKKRLKLKILKTESSQRIVLEIIPCKDHPEDGLILWPQRDDIMWWTPDDYINMGNSIIKKHNVKEHD